MSGLRVIFMGTPDFAVSTLDALVLAGYTIPAVITVPDKPAGRGQQLQQSAVKKYALEKGLPVLQPEKLKDPAFLDQLRSLKADIQVVVAFRMLPELVWNMPPMGTINLHGSLLPQYRGAAPINRAVMNGEKETGVTTFFLQHEIDTGKIIFQEHLPITEADTAGTVHDRLMVTGAQLVLKTLRAIEAKNYPQTDQEQLVSGELKAAPKLFKDDCRIHWQNSMESIYNQVRGLSPYPTAFCQVKNEKGTFTLKVFSCKKIAVKPAQQAGTWSSDGKNYLQVAALDGSLSLTDVQLEGKKRMRIADFLRGFPLTDKVEFL